MPEQWRTIELPFESGLQQKSDQLWTEPGQAATAQNLIRLKTKSFAKRLGLRSQSTSLASFNPLGSAPQTSALVGGHRLASQRGNPLMIVDGNFPSILARFSEVTSQPYAVDLLPEAYVFPYEYVGSPGAPTVADPAGTIYQMDVAVTNGFECIVWTDPGAAGGRTDLYILIRVASTGVVLFRQMLLTNLVNLGQNADMVKVCAVGNHFLVTFATATADNSIYALDIDTTQNLGQGVQSAATIINTSANDSVNNVTAALANPYDVCPVLGDTAKFALIYEATRAGPTRTIRIIIYTLAGFVVVSDTAIDASDTQWTTDNGVGATSSQLTALSLRADSTNSEVGYAYGWRTLAGATRVSAGIRNYPAMTSKATAVNLMASPFGSMSAANDKAPAIVTIERNPTSGNYTTRFSPGSAVLGKSTAQLPYIASWQANTSAGAMTVAAHQPRVTWGLSLWSRDLLQNGIAYLIAQLPSDTQGSFFLMADDFWNDTATVVPAGAPLRLVGNLAPRLSNPLVPSVASPLASRVASHFVLNPNAPGGVIAESVLAVAIAATVTATAKIAFDFKSQLIGQSSELGQNLHIACGSPSATDSQTVFELAFPHYPVITNVVCAGAAGALSAGSYNWIAVYEWIDTSGQKHRSARSVPFTQTAAATNTATLTVATMGFSAKIKNGILTMTPPPLASNPQGINGPLQTGIAIKIYRTQVNSTVYTNILTGDAIATFATTFTNTFTITDAASDASILSNALLYGDGSDGTSPGNILDNLCPPAAQAMCVHQNRSFFVDGPRIWPTKNFTFGEGSGVNEATAFSVDDGPGNVLGLASMDDKLVIFKGDRLFYMTGLGPADNGTGNDWSPPQRIASDVGLVDWRSLVTTPQGIHFRSPAGRRLLTRDLQVVPVPVVEDLDNLYPVQTSAVIHPTAGRVIWTQNMNDTATPRSGAIVVHDYVLDTWTSHVFNDNAGHATTGFVSAVLANAQLSAGPPAVVQPVMHFLRADGTVMREDVAGGTSLDTATGGGGTIFVPAKWVSPWLKSDGLQGWSTWRMVRISLQVVDPAACTISIAYNYLSTPVDVRTFTAAQIAAATQQGVWLAEIRPTQPRAAALQITITDASDTGTTTGAGFLFEHVRVDYDFEAGGYRAPSGQRG